MPLRPHVVRPFLIIFVFVSMSIGKVEPGRTQEQRSLGIELNKVEQTDQGCRPVFLFDNATGHQLKRFQVEMALFDPKGVYSKQILLDMAPLYPGKKVVASFLIAETDCADIGSILVNDLPSCETSDGTALDCLALLQVASRAEMPLEK